MPGDDWTVIVPSGDLPPGAAVPVDVAGGAEDGGELELVAWRGHDGLVCVMEARCPHQWSHLGVEGVVDGDELVCASHFWRFDRTGGGSKLNVLGRRDPKSGCRVYPSRERDGVVEARLPGGPSTPRA